MSFPSPSQLAPCSTLTPFPSAFLAELPVYTADSFSRCPAGPGGTERDPFRCPRVPAFPPSRCSLLPGLTSYPLPLPLKHRGRAGEPTDLTGETGKPPRRSARPAGGPRGSAACSTRVWDPGAGAPDCCSSFIWKGGHSAHLPTRPGSHMDGRGTRAKS